MNSLSLLTLAKTEPGGAWTHPYYLTDEETKAPKGLNDLPKFPSFLHEGLSQSSSP